MDPDERPYSLGWATDGCVEPRTVHTTDEHDPPCPAEIAEQHDLDTWWAQVAGNPMEGRKR